MIMAALLIGILGTAPQPTLDCQLAKDIANAALTRTIYLGGIFEETSSVVEKATLSAEIVALEQLREQMVVWRRTFCMGSYPCWFCPEVMTRVFFHTEERKHEFELPLPFPIGIDSRSSDILFADDICRVCGYHSKKHRLVFANELTSEWKICATEQIHFTTSTPIETRYICIHIDEQAEYMTREEFEELYDDE